MNRTTYILISAILTISTSLLSAQSLVVEAPKVVEIGEPFQIVYTVNSEPSKFINPDFGKLEVLAGPLKSTISSTQIINGKRSQSFQINYTFTLLANSEGKFNVSQAEVVVGSKSIQSKSVTVEVVKSSANSKESSSDTKVSRTISEDDLFLKSSVNRVKAVKGEQILLTIKLYSRVNIEGFEDVKFPTFNGFWSQEIDSPQNIEFERENYNGKLYQTALIRKYLLIPQESGSLSIDPAEMVTLVQVRGGSSSSNTLDAFFDTYSTVRKRLKTSSIRINVEPLPAGAPSSFTGGVGDFKMDVKLNKDALKANDAASLIVTISGKGNINLLDKPNITLPAEFETYDVKITDNSKSSGGVLTGNKQFEYPFIPRSHGTYTIPSLSFTYYDINKRAYITIKSPQFEIIVSKDDNPSVNSTSSIGQGASKQSVSNLNRDIRYLKKINDSKNGGNFFIKSFLFYIILAIIILGSYIIDFILKREARLKQDVSGMKRRRADKVAKARLIKANQYLLNEDKNRFYEELHKAILGYCSDKLSLNISELSRENLKTILLEKGVDENDIDSLEKLLDACEYARYSPDNGQVSMDLDYKSAVKLISDLEV